MRSKKRPRKIVDEEHTLRCAGKLGLLREEVWVNADEVVVRYNLAFIHHGLASKDNGRVLGYDNQHGRHHRTGMAGQKTLRSALIKTLSTGS